MIKRMVSAVLATVLSLTAFAQSRIESCSMQSRILGVEKE